uniref:Filamin-binding LIM protein 1 isoform X1 n=2 Tax=Pogona vitticeps TaxID=103695 RepID=A0A6J0SVP4_9SAUR|nr:filamin-binding LIM protein 1 isoform X1 [Pogona vitticeps]
MRVVRWEAEARQPAGQVKMLSEKVQKRMASSVFITLVPPRRDLYAKTETRPQKAPILPHNKLPKESGTSVGPIPSQTPDSANLRSKDHCPGDSNMPNRALYSKPFSAEVFGPDFQKETEALPKSLQTSSFPVEMRQSKILPLTLNGAEEQQTVKKRENAVSTEICAFCHKAISPWVPTLEAMNKQYHADCFTCRTCQHALAGKRYYQKDGQPLCVACYQNTLEKCAMCQALILTQIVHAMSNSYHPECFTCVVCARAIGDETFALDESNQVHCLDDFYRKFASVCGSCEKPIIPSDGRDLYKIECMGRNFHEDCYRCEKCHILLCPEPTEDGCYPLGSCLLCKFCHVQQTKKTSY